MLLNIYAQEEIRLYSYAVKHIRCSRRNKLALFPGSSLTLTKIKTKRGEPGIDLQLIL